jgi:hypothetical protein
MEFDARKSGKAMLGRPQGVLAGEDQAHGEPAPGQGSDDGRKLDRFWTGSDNDVDTRTGQPSP